MLSIRWTYPVAKGMGFAQGELVLEVGYDTDCDDALRNEISATIKTDFLEGSATEVVDADLPELEAGPGHPPAGAGIMSPACLS